MKKQCIIRFFCSFRISFQSIKSNGEEILSIPSHSLLAVEKQIDKDDDVDSSGEAGHAKHDDDDDDDSSGETGHAKHLE